MSRVVVVGAGVVGLCIADSLIRRGFEVTVVDREHTLGDGCSYGNGGLIVPSHFVPLAAPGMVRLGLKMLMDKQSPLGVERWTDLEVLGWMTRFALNSTKRNVDRYAPLLKEMNLQSRSAYEALIGRLGVDVGYAHRGLLMLCETRNGLDDEAALAQEASRLGLRTAVLNRDEVAKLDPGIRMNVCGAVHFRDDAHLTPASLMHALETHLRTAGVTFRLGVEVTRVLTSSGKATGVDTSEGAITADEVVLAGGAWTGKLARTAGINLQLIAGRGFGLTVPTPPEMPTIPSILTEARVAVTPMQTGLHFVGTMELAQPSIKSDSPRVDGVKRGIKRVFPSLNDELLNVKPWCGLRPCTPDGVPYIGRASKVQNLTIAAGHAMMGMSLGPITGELVQHILTGDPSPIDLNLLTPERHV